MTFGHEEWKLTQSRALPNNIYIYTKNLKNIRKKKKHKSRVNKIMIQHWTNNLMSNFISKDELHKKIR
jgi:hypothetical protein